MGLRLATRASALAMAQSRRVAARLGALGLDVELLPRTTRGDAVLDRPFRAIEGKGFFTKELEEALLSNDADLAVHSLKDLPTELPKGLTIAAVTERTDPADVLLVRAESVDERRPLPVSSGARVGTSSSRRRAQWLARRPDTELRELRGNVPTRVEKLRRGEFDAIVLAAAGLERLSLDVAGLYVRRLDPSVFVCAPGQGALAVEARSADAALTSQLALLDDAAAREAVEAERAVLTALGGGCSQPVGAHARRAAGTCLLDAVVGPNVEGASPLRRAAARAATFREAVESVLTALRSASSEVRPRFEGKTFVLTQQPHRSERLARELEERGARVLEAPLVETRPLEGAAARVREAWDSCDYVALTSVSAAFALPGPETISHAPTVAAVGTATAEALERRGYAVALAGSGAGAAELAYRIAADAHARGIARARVLFPSALEPRPELEAALAAAGHAAIPIPVYETLERIPASLADLLSGPADAALFFSPSAVRAFARARPFEARQWIAAGASTLRALEDAGFPGARAAASPAPHDLIEALA